MRSPERLSVALKRTVAQMDIAARMQADAAMCAWPEIVGPVCAAKTRPFLVHEGVMVVKVASSVWANQLNLLKPQYLKALAERVGAGVVTDLRWRVGLGEAEESAQDLAVPASRPEPIPLQAVALTDAECEAIASRVAGIPDPKLARRLTQTLTIVARRQHWMRQAGMAACARCGVLGPAIANDPDTCCPACRRLANTPTLSGPEENPDG